MKLNKYILGSVSLCGLIFSCTASFATNESAYSTHSIKAYVGDTVDLKYALDDIKNIDKNSKIYVTKPVSTKKEGKYVGEILIQDFNNHQTVKKIDVEVLNKISEDAKYIPKSNIRVLSIRKGSLENEINFNNLVAGLPENSKIMPKNKYDFSNMSLNKIQCEVILPKAKFDMDFDIKIIEPMSETIKLEKKIILAKLNSSVSPEKAFINLPDKSIVKFVKTPYTGREGFQKNDVEILFADNSKLTTQVNVNVVKNIKNSTKDDFHNFKPMSNISINDSQKIDLRKEIKNLPEDFNVSLIDDIRYEEGSYKTKIQIEFEGITKEEYININVKKSLAKSYVCPIKNIKIKEGDNFFISNYDFNLKSGSEISLINTIDTSISSIQEAKFEICFKDGSKKIFNIPVIVQ